MSSLADKIPVSCTDTFLITDLLILKHAREPAIEDGALVIQGDAIIDVGSNNPIAKAYPNARRVDGKGFLAMPGLINAHTHAPMSFFRGLGHGPVAKAGGGTTMIEELFYPAEKNLTEDLIEPLSYSYLIDGLKCGVTSFVDSYAFSGAVGRAMTRLGVRGVIGEHIADLGGHLPSGRDLWLKVRQRIENWEPGGLVTPMVYAHATDTMSKALLTEIGAFAQKLDLPFQMHLSQSDGERSRVQAREGVTPVQFAEQCRVLTPRTMAVHLVSADDDDARRLKASGAWAVICAVSEIIYERLPPLARLAHHGVPWLIGTDCAASNDGADMLAEMRYFRLAAKENGVPADRIAPSEILAAATVDASHVLGLNCGELSRGKAADCVFLERDVTTEPIPDLAVNLIHSFSARHVSHVMVGGRWALWKRRPVQLSQSDAQGAYRTAVHEIKKRAGLK